MGDDVKIKRCAIYTRKSHEDVVEKDFNSIQAQREAGESYVNSQKANGWVLLEKRYDDYGYSGGSMNRPALKELLKDCEDGKVDVVVFYKLDRLSRSICDFADLSKSFAKWNVAFVSVTQQIDTSTSAGKMMLNLLAAFAEFEREVISERIRDKKAATRRKGKWDGGIVPYGFSVADRKLVGRPDEADVVRHVFRRFTEIQSPKRIAMELNESGRLYRKGRKWSVKQVACMLRNVVYIGKVCYKGETYDGEHEGIVDQETWDTAQAYLAGNVASGDTERRLDSMAPLKGILRCGHCDGAMTPTYTSKGGNRKYCFYICAKDAKRAVSECPVKRLPAGEIEGYVFGRLGALLRSPEVVAAVADLAGLPTTQVSDALCGAYTDGMTQGEKRRLAELLLESVVVKEDEIVIELKTNGMEGIAKEAYGI
jgi:site-specific DNA recombinase